jgi:phytoene dehydrogenase-like protein
MTESCDAVVIGAGHNGLVCAAYLARAGLKVLVCEASAAPGGMAREREFGDVYRVPALAHLQPGLGANIVSDLGLEQHGYSPDARVDTVAIGGKSGPLVLSADSVDGPELAAGDAEAYRDFRARYLDFSAALTPLFQAKPPRLRNFAPGDRKVLARTGWNLRFGLGRESMYEFLRVAAINIYDLLNEHFEDDRLKGAIAFDAVLGSAMGPRTPGTVLAWLHRLANERAGETTYTDAGLVRSLCTAARSAGASIRLASPVDEILIDDDRAIGVRLAGGEKITAARVVAAIDPRQTFLQLVGAPRLDATFSRRAAQIRGSGVVGKLHLGLTGLPEVAGVDPKLLGSRMVLAPSMRYVERAFNPAKYGEYSAEPVLEITLPSSNDPSLAPEGHHVMSVNVAYLPYHLKSGWQTAREPVIRHVIAELGRYMPGIEDLVTAIDFLSPQDIAREYGAVEGHWHHGELSIHQSLMLRPLYGAAQYDTPLDGLYLCSAGCHPGGGLSGLPGHNAAMRILESGSVSP